MVALWCVVMAWVVWLWCGLCGGAVWKGVLCGGGAVVALCGGVMCVWWPCDVVWVVWKGLCGGAVVWWCCGVW